ncbi:hypothetical protein CYMTET_33385 [Cymbomonas tetramitiformis]|uniref:Uncharacterized protein n=1 Tax=Cymbomonas tetramitiformis TaxID=36881 RepID=A0AAE0FDC4_9CHLO|nr:hypothetical protein CYMTET_33385 [Cymbomonas tetramitiformis]
MMDSKGLDTRCYRERACSRQQRRQRRVATVPKGGVFLRLLSRTLPRTHTHTEVVAIDTAGVSEPAAGFLKLGTQGARDGGHLLTDMARPRSGGAMAGTATGASPGTEVGATPGPTPAAMAAALRAGVRERSRPAVSHVSTSPGGTAPPEMPEEWVMGGSHSRRRPHPQEGVASDAACPLHQGALPIYPLQHVMSGMGRAPAVYQRPPQVDKPRSWFSRGPVSMCCLMLATALPTSGCTPEGGLDGSWGGGKEGPATYGFLWKTQRRFKERRYMEGNVGGEGQVDGDTAKHEDEETALGSYMGWKETWIWALEVALEETDHRMGMVAGRKDWGRCNMGSPGRLPGCTEAQSAKVSAGASGSSQTISSVQDILAEGDDLSSPGPESGVWTHEQSGASPEQAVALAEEGVTTLL